MISLVIKVKINQMKWRGGVCSVAHKWPVGSSLQPTAQEKLAAHTACAFCGTYDWITRQKGRSASLQSEAAVRLSKHILRDD